MPIVVKYPYSDERSGVFIGKAEEIAQLHVKLAKDKSYLLEKRLKSYNSALCFTKNENTKINVLLDRSYTYLSENLLKEVQQNMDWIKEIIHQKMPDQQEKHSREFFLDLAVKKEDGNLCAREDIAPGIVIAIENVRYGNIVARKQASCCKNCLKSNNLSLIPCDTCNLAMFCSTHCKETAIFHRDYECNECELYEIPLDMANILCTLRFVGEMLHFFNNDAGKMISYINMFNEDQAQAMKIAETDERLADLTSFLHLRRIKTSVYDIKYRKIVKKCIKSYPKFCKMFKHNSEKNFLIDFVADHAVEIVLHTDAASQELTSFGIHNIYSALENSCSSNVYGMLVQGQMYYITKFPIEKGERLTYNHGFEFEECEKTTRNNYLMNVFGVECKCKACAENYPLFGDLPVMSKNIHKSIREDIENIANMDRKGIANSLFCCLCSIKKNYAHFPCQEIILMHRLMKLLIMKLKTHNENE